MMLRIARYMMSQRGMRAKGNQYMRRHVKDKFVKDSLKMNYRSRAAFKLLQMNEKYQILRPDSKILEVGAAPGSWTQVITEKLGPRGLLVSVDILEMKDVPGAKFIKGSIADKNVHHKISETLNNQKADLICSDAAPEITGQEEVDTANFYNLYESIQQTCELFLKPEGALLMKIFQGKNHKDIIALLKESFNNIRHIKPEASRNESREIYIFAEGFKPLPKKEDIKTDSLQLHNQNKGKIEMKLKTSIRNDRDLALVYTPGVAFPCLEISKKREEVYKYTNAGNTVAVLSDGSAVLGLGDIGPYAGLPVMEGKCALFKQFAGIDAFPIMVNSTDPEEIIRTAKLIAPSFGGINLEDISAPKCFDIEDRLVQELDIPVMHDDQHGTAIVVMAALINSLKLAGKEMSNVKIVFSGAGAAGTAITKMLIQKKVKDIIVTDRAGAIYRERKQNMNQMKEKIALMTNPDNVKGSLDTIISGADIFIGVSSGGLLKPDLIKKMNSHPIIFALANPEPEIYPEEAKKAGAFIVATGRSDFPNQINNCLAFPGVFKGALMTRSKITYEMKNAAASCLAEIIVPTVGKILPSVFHPNLASEVAKAVIKETSIIPKYIQSINQMGLFENLLIKGEQNDRVLYQMFVFLCYFGLLIIFL